MYVRTCKHKPLVPTPVVTEYFYQYLSGIVRQSLALFHHCDFLLIHMLFSISENKEKLILYLCLGLCVGVILLLLVIIIRLMMTRRRKESPRQKLDISEPMETSAPPENMTLLNDSDRNDGIEMLSFNQSNSLRRPPPGGTLTRSNPYSRPDPGNHSINNYYG